jgi:hypothetical protein
VRSLEAQLQERQAELQRLEAQLRSEMAQRQREESQVAILEKEVADLGGQLAETAGAQARWQQRESELEACIREHEKQLAEASAAATVREVELNRLSSSVEELHILQSALCARVKELTAQNDAAAGRVKDLEDHAGELTRTLEGREQDLAALRHAILDAARLGGRFSRERLQVECEVVEGWKRLISTLLHTPLSAAQRGIVSEINGAMNGWKRGRVDATQRIDLQVEPPDLHRSEFNCAEVVEAALAAVRKTAEGAGLKARAALVGSAPDSARGNAKQIHQLITLLSASLPEVVSTETLDLQVAFEGEANGASTMRLQLTLSPVSGDGSPWTRVATITAASAKLRTVGSRESELALASAWQLALALGANPSLETAADGKLLISIVLPLVANSLLHSSNETRVEPVETSGVF